MLKRENDKEEEVYKFIKSQIRKKGCPPSVREICPAIGVKSTSTVHKYLKKLEKEGLIIRRPNKSRAIELLKKDEKEMINVPIIGTIAAGKPILATENIEDTFPIPIDYIESTNPLFILKVKGESMVDIGILNGDFAIIEQTNVAENGEIVAALIGNEATLKRFFKEKNYIRLQPENKTMTPIIALNCTILGKLVGVYREY